MRWALAWELRNVLQTDFRSCERALSNDVTITQVYCQSQKFGVWVLATRDAMNLDHDRAGLLRNPSDHAIARVGGPRTRAEVVAALEQVHEACLPVPLSLPH